MFLILGIIKCTLATWLFVKSTWLLEIIYPTSLTRIMCFQLSHLHKDFTCLDTKPFPSSWSFFMMPVSTCCDKDRKPNKSGRSILREEMSCLFMRKLKHFLCFLQTFFPLSFVAAVVNQPTEEGRGSVHAGAFHLFTDRCSFCAGNIRCSELLQTPSPFCWALPCTRQSCSSLITMKNSSTNAWQESWRVPLRWLCFTKTTTQSSASLRWKRKHKSWRARDAEL